MNLRWRLGSLRAASQNETGEIGELAEDRSIHAFSSYPNGEISNHLGLLPSDSRNMDTSGLAIAIPWDFDAVHHIWHPGPVKAVAAFLTACPKGATVIRWFSFSG